MKISLNCPDAHSPGSPDAFLLKIGLEDLGSHVHGARRNQDLRHIYLVRLEFLADYVHSGQKAVLQHSLGTDAGLHCLFDQFFNGLCFAFLKIFGDLVQNAHIYLVFQESVCSSSFLISLMYTASEPQHPPM